MKDQPGIPKKQPRRNFGAAIIPINFVEAVYKGEALDLLRLLRSEHSDTYCIVLDLAKRILTISSNLINLDAIDSEFVANNLTPTISNELPSDISSRYLLVNLYLDYREYTDKITFGLRGRLVVYALVEQLYLAQLQN